MLKRLIILILASIPLLASASMAIGDWQIYKAYNDPELYKNDMWSAPFTGYKMQDTPDKIYISMSGSMYSYDKKTDEFYNYTARNILSDNYVNGLWYNAEGKYIVVAYDNGNLDLLYDGGKVVNLPDIRDANISGSKRINDIVFDGDRMCVATDFGVVVFNVAKRSVVQTGNFGICIVSLALSGDNLIMVSSYGPFEIRYASLNSKIGKWVDLYKLSGFYGNNMRSLGNNKYLVRSNKDNVGYVPYLFTINLEDNTVYRKELVSDPIDYFQRAKDGTYYVVNSSGTKIYTFDSNGELQSTINVPENLKGNNFSYWESAKEIWSGGDGLAQYDLLSSPITVLHQPIKPNAPTVRRANVMRVTPSNRILMSNMGVSSTFSTTQGQFRNEVSYLNYLDNGIFTDITPKHLKEPYPVYSNLTDDKLYDVLGVVEDPTNPDRILVSVFWTGLIVMEKNSEGIYEEKYKFDNTNSYLRFGMKPTGSSSKIGVPAGQAEFDRHGNLWLLQAETSPTPEVPAIMMLPAEKFKKSKIEKSDWVPIVITPFATNFSSQMLICKHSDMIFFSDGAYEPHIIAYDTKGTTDTKDDKYFVWDTFIDQDGKNFPQEYMYSVIEDNEGRVWFGTSTGIMEFSNPREATNSQININRLKVPRNDGSGFADYLLDNQIIYSMAVDGANNKWIGTESSGLYKVSPNGDRVLEHFTEENSYLPSNTVYQVVCDPNSTSIIAATPYGISEYSSDVSQPNEDYSEVYAFPNPVRPDYSGLISVKGLVDGSRVKIADTSGNVVFDGFAQGGLITWNGCYYNGNRVRSGVYYVYMSKTGEGLTSMGAVTKIMVIN